MKEKLKKYLTISTKSIIVTLCIVVPIHLVAKLIGIDGSGVWFTLGVVTAIALRECDSYFNKKHNDKRTNI